MYITIFAQSNYQNEYLDHLVDEVVVLLPNASIGIIYSIERKATRFFLLLEVLQVIRAVMIMMMMIKNVHDIVEENLRKILMMMILKNLNQSIQIMKIMIKIKHKENSIIIFFVVVIIVIHNV